MKHLYHAKNKYSPAEEKLRKLFGYDDASLMKEADEASREWKQEKEANPEKEKETEKEGMKQAESALLKIRLRGIEPDCEGKSEKEGKRGRHWMPGGFAINKKIFLIMTVTAILALSASMVSIATSRYQYGLYPMAGGQSMLVGRNTTTFVENGELDTAYDIAEQSLQIPILTLGYKPKGMKYKGLLIDDRQVVFEFDYYGKNIYLREFECQEKDEVYSIASDRTEYKKIHNQWLDADISISRNIMKSGEAEYHAGVVLDEAYYFIEGEMEEEEFERIVTDLVVR